MAEVFERLGELLRQGRGVAMATIVEASGSVPRAAGARMIVAGPEETWFSVGGGLFEQKVVDLCVEVLETGESRLESFDFRPEDEGGFGAVCGGSVRVFVEAVRPPHRLLVVGAGHCGTALARIAVQSGFSVRVADDRPHLLDPSRFPLGVVLIDAGEEFSRLPEPAGDESVAVITRDFRGDLAAMRRVLPAGPPYLGMIGSKRKRHEVYEALRADGASEDALDGVRCPIGLDIGADTPEEIAIAVLAEIIAARRGPGNPAD